MSDTQFTALDWRPSPRRATYPRVKPYGGQKQAPAAFLAAAKVSGFGSGKHRRCARANCTGWAMRETTVCRLHGGGKIASQSRPYVKSRRRAARHAQALASPSPSTIVDD
jgi:hypothetical protein